MVISTSFIVWVTTVADFRTFVLKSQGLKKDYSSRLGDFTLKITVDV